MLLDGQDSTSLIGSYEVFKESNALLLLKNSLLKNRSLYKQGYTLGRYYWGPGDYKLEDFDQYSERIVLSGTNWLATHWAGIKVQWFDYSRPKEYEHLLTIAKMIEEIKHQEVVIDTKRLKADSYKAKNMAFSQTLRKVRNRVSYKLFGTKTGRLTVDKGYFPVLTLDKELRKYVIPNNDLFIEIDVNGAEIRTLLALLGEEQPDVDIHDWNVENVYKSGTREEAKKRFFAWLYNPASNDDASSDTYNRELIKKRFWDGEKVTTPFFREIDSDEYHCVNYTLQSTSNDVCLEQAKKVFDILGQKKSKIAFLMHDSIILDFAASEKSLLREIIEAFRDTRFGQYRVNVNMGKNFGEMKEINWKQ